MRTTFLPIAFAASLAGAACSGAVFTTAPAGPPGDGGEDAATVHGSDDASPEAAPSPQGHDGSPEAAADGAPDGTEPQPEAGPAPTPVPIAVDSTHLRLWLTADRGLTCALIASTAAGAVHRVTYWADQSGHGDDASLRRGQLGPQCEVAGGHHSAAGVDLPYFSAPQGGNVIDETLDVDLTFLATPAFTVFVVERRWADYSAGTSKDQEILLGTSEPAAVEAANPQTCSTVTPNQIFSLGYRYGSTAPALTYDQWCGISMAEPVTSVPATPPAPLSVDTVRLDSALGHSLWVGGLEVASNVGTAAVVTAQGGAVGRGFVVTTVSGQDMRFRGDIAEIVAYDTSLADSQRAEVESYLRGHWGP